jgi:hypothetical protein
MPQVRNSFDADRNRDYFFTVPLLTMTSGEGKKFWRRFDAISPKRKSERPNFRLRLRSPYADRNSGLESMEAHRQE